MPVRLYKSMKKDVIAFINDRGNNWRRREE